MKWIVLAGLLAVSCPATAQNVIVKCVGPKGAVVYQSTPCEQGHTQASAKRYEAVYDSPAAARQVQEAERVVAARRAAYRNQAQAAYVPPSSSHGACESAKANRDAILKAAGMSRTYDLLQRLDEDVRRACK